MCVYIYICKTPQKRIGVRGGGNGGGGGRVLLGCLERWRRHRGEGERAGALCFAGRSVQLGERGEAGGLCGCGLWATTLRCARPYFPCLSPHLALSPPYFVPTSVRSSSAAHERETNIRLPLRSLFNSRPMSSHPSCYHGPVP